MKSTPTPGPFRDPREAPGFDPALWPTWDSSALEPASDAKSLLKLRLAAAYYGINQEYRALQGVRQEPDTPARAERARAALQQIEQAILAKERVEAECAPLGLIPEPVVRDGAIVDLKFGPKHQPRGQPSSISNFFQVRRPSP